MSEPRNLFFVLIAVLLMLFSGCSTRKTLGPGGGADAPPCPSAQKEGVDTIGYTVTFSDSIRREQFVSSFQSFLDHYQFAQHKKDTIAGQVVIRMFPAAQGGSSPSLSPLEPDWITESTTEGRFDESATAGDTSRVDDTVEPIAGGTVRIHLKRKSVDRTFFPLLAAPFAVRSEQPEARLFSVSMTSPRKVTVTIDNTISDGSGRPISALDLIEICTGYIRQHPAEGLALFRNVDGVMEFVQGKEAVVRGFGATDQYTFTMKLRRPDRQAARRLATDRTLGIYSKLGPYYPVRATKEEMICLANRATDTASQTFLDTLIFNISDDSDPILSFSLRKYDAVTLTLTSDIEYARSTLDTQAVMQVVSQDRYFISCACADSMARVWFASRVNAAGLLHSTVKAEGKLIGLIESEVDSVMPRVIDNPPSAPLKQRFRILFREDDGVSRMIAEKLLADLSNEGVRCSLAGRKSTDYERALLERSYECAVGWVDKAVKTDVTEKMRLATMYFRDMASEQERVDGFWEVPLFRIHRYLLMRKPAGLYKNRVTGIFAASRSETEALNESR